MNVLAAAGILAGSYALGSVSFAYLATRRIKGVDLRTVGSGNLGATNAARVLGKTWGRVIFVLDLAKGLAPVVVVRALGDPAPFGASAPPLAPLAGLAAFVGHCYPAWHGFRGGKGVATASGVVLALSPYAGLCAFAVFYATVKTLRMISVGSVVATASLPVLHVLFTGQSSLAGRGRWTSGLFLLLAAWVVVRHRANLARVFAGTEPRIGEAPTADGRRGGDSGDGRT
jgi:acyl phosphate:glycerol-3-phosphate acyltransferase